MNYRTLPEESDARRLSVALIPLLAGGVAGLVIVALSDPSKIGAVFVGMIAVAVAATRIELGLAALVFLTYSALSDVLSGVHGAPPVIWPMAGLLVVAILIRSIFFNERYKGWLLPSILIGIYGSVCLASLMWAADAVRTRAGLVEFAQAVVLAVIVMMLLQNFRTLHKVTWALLAAGILMGTIGVYQYFTGTFNKTYWGFGQAELRQIAGGYESYRITGPLGDSNFFAQVMLVLIPLSLERAWNERSKLLRLAAIWALAVSALCVIFTFSRGAFVASMLLLFVFALRSRLRAGHYVLLAICLLVALPFLPDEYTDRMKTLVEVIPGIGEGVRADSAFRGRASELAAGWLMFVDHPIGGVGFGNYPDYYQEYSQRVGLDSRLADRSAHSMYLQILAETGLLGILTFGLLLWAVFRGMRRAARMLKEAGMQQHLSMLHAFDAALVGYFCAAIFLHTAYPRYLWLLIAIGFAIRQVVRNEVGQQVNENRNDQRDSDETSMGDFYAEPRADIR